MVGVVPPGTRLRPPNPADITTSFFRYQRLNGRRWEMWMSACDPGFIRPDEPALVTSGPGGGLLHVTDMLFRNWSGCRWYSHGRRALRSCGRPRQTRTYPANSDWIGSTLPIRNPLG